MLKAVRHHTNCAWVLLYIERWLKAPVQMEDGSVVPRTAGTPQGGVISPLLANLFLHYAFDAWMSRNYPHIPFERYADDAICHCKNAALDIRDYMGRTNIARSRLGLPCWNIRIGIHTGGVIAGVVGKKKFTYDVWGDAVNTAALMEAHAEPGTILLSDSTFGHLHGDFETVFRGEINTAKKGSLRCYVLNDRKGKATG